MAPGATAIHAILAVLDQPLLMIAGTADKIVDLETQSEALHQQVTRRAPQLVGDAGVDGPPHRAVAVAEAIEQLTAPATPALTA